MEALTLTIRDLRESSGDPLLSVEMWLPTKQVQAYNPRLDKLASKSVKYKDGGWLFLQCILTNALYEAISNTYYFLSWRNTAAWQRGAEVRMTQKRTPPLCSGNCRCLLRSKQSVWVESSRRAFWRCPCPVVTTS